MLRSRARAVIRCSSTLLGPPAHRSTVELRAGAPGGGHRVRSAGATTSRMSSSSKRRKTGAAASAGRDWTVSIALPGSIIANAQTAELKTYLAGQVARAAVVFNVDEIVVFADRRTPGDRSKSTQGQFQGAVKGASFDADVFLARLLQYLETPQCVSATAAQCPLLLH
jgi:hypothetical protein